MKKEIVITRIIEFGGGNTYLKSLVKYIGEENLILIIKNKEDLEYLNKIDPVGKIAIKFIPHLTNVPHFKKFSILQNLVQVFKILRSIFTVFGISARLGFAGVSISVIEPENYLYLLFLPFIKVKYILHSYPIIAKKRLTPFICNTTLNYNKIIITVSNSNRESILKNWKISPSKAKFVHLVYNCLHENENKENKSVIDNRAQLIITMGHVVEYKNPYLWLEVAKKVVSLRNNTFFYWLGNGSLLDIFQEKVKYLDNINFVGLIDNTYSFLSNATIYYQPSLIETHGIAVIEAMSNRLPCIVSNIGGLPESVEHNKNGFVINASNVDEHVSSILELLDNDNLCKSFGQNSYLRYKQFFTPEVFKREMDKIYWA